MNTVRRSVTIRNDAIVDEVTTNDDIIVQIPIRVIHPEDLIHEGRWNSGTIDGLQVVNKARVEHIRGVGCVIIQIPILLFNLRIDDEKFWFKYVRLKNMSHVDIMRGNNNVLIQMPLFIIVNSMTDPSHPMVNTTINNTVSHQLMSGENNILIQMPVQFSPDI